MTATAEISDFTLKLRALDPDLPMLAARAAMELDNYRSSGDRGFFAVKQLSRRLRNSFQSQGAATHKALLDSGTVTLLGRALNSSKWAGDVSTIDQLSAELWEVAERLEGVEGDPGQQPIEKIRDFCVALSECAASYRQAFYDLRPPHPFRK
jgi:hypothetical protein